MELDFDEPVIGETINVSAITLKTAQTWPYESVTLSDNSRVVKTDPGGRYDQCGDSAGNRSKACDYARIYESMQKPAFLFDGRNILDHESLQGLGYEVWAVGKSLEKLDAQ